MPYGLAARFLRWLVGNEDMNEETDKREIYIVEMVDIVDNP
jgi:hypothetical protein